MPNGEVLWPRSLIVPVLKALAAAGLVILGFDIVVRGSRGPSVWGTSSYAMDGDLRVKEWPDCVSRAFELAVRDVARTPELAGLTPPLDDVWYVVVAIDKAEAERFKHARVSVDVKSPIRKSPTIKLFLDSRRTNRQK